MSAAPAIEVLAARRPGRSARGDKVAPRRGVGTSAPSCRQSWPQARPRSEVLLAVGELTLAVREWAGPTDECAPRMMADFARGVRWRGGRGGALPRALTAGSCRWVEHRSVRRW